MKRIIAGIVFAVVVGILVFYVRSENSPLPVAAELRVEYHPGSTATSEYLVLTPLQTPTYLSGLVVTSGNENRRLPFATPLPRLGTSATLRPVVIRSADEKIIVSSGHSPLGVSFRENSCTGFFEEMYQFTPPLTEDCPAALEVVESQTAVTDNVCRSYLQSLPACRSKQHDFPAHLPASCISLVKTYLTYEGCISGRRTTSGFQKPTTRLFLESSTPLFVGSTTPEIYTEGGVRVSEPNTK